MRELVAEAMPRHDRVPVFEALVDYAQRGVVGLHTPAHRGRAMPAGLERLLTRDGLACDLPSLPETDNWFHPRGCIEEAQQLAAELYGAEQTYYLAHGSTIGVQAMVLATVNPGEKVLLSRASHVSLFNALVLSGAVPVYLPQQWHPAAGPLPSAPGEVADALAGDPGIRAVFVTSPTYYGLTAPIADLAAVCHAAGVPLLVDEAHGAHLEFLPGGRALTAVRNGADAVVQSAHKTLGSLVGTAQLHRPPGSAIAPDRLQSALNLLQSTSASYLLLASIDVTRRGLARDGYRRFAEAAAHACRLREALQAAGVFCLTRAGQDPLRLTVAAGAGAFEAERRLMVEHGILDEFCDGANLVFVLTPDDSADEYDRLVKALVSLPRDGDPRAPVVIVPPLALTPREAFSRGRVSIPTAVAAGRICAERITLYPPGIPLILPGELVTAEVVAHCLDHDWPADCVLANDPTLRTLSVIEEETR